LKEREEKILLLRFLNQQLKIENNRLEKQRKKWKGQSRKLMVQNKKLINKLNRVKIRNINVNPQSNIDILLTTTK
jgi:hypothetical protein